jgi:predicted nucleic acid-binding protein
VILPDSPAWVEYLRATGSDVDLWLNDLLEEQDQVATTEVVVMEVLAGARRDEQRDKLRRLLRRFALLSAGDLATYEHAAEVYRACRRGGETIRKMTDCLIAAVAIQEGAAVLHRDADFAAIARHTSLDLASLDGPAP